MDCCANVYCFDVFLLSIKDSERELRGPLRLFTKHKTMVTQKETFLIYSSFRQKVKNHRVI